MPDYILSETMCPVRESIFALSKPSYSWVALSKPRVTCIRMISKVMENIGKVPLDHVLSNMVEAVLGL